MPLDHEPEQSMEEIVGEEIRKEIDFNRGHRLAFIHFFNNFPLKILGTLMGDVRSFHLATINGRSPEQFAKDVIIAIKESGVDEKALRGYVDFLRMNGLSEGDDESYRKLILPVFIKLREMGYRTNDLGR